MRKRVFQALLLLYLIGALLSWFSDTLQRVLLSLPGWVQAILFLPLVFYLLINLLMQLCYLFPDSGPGKRVRMNKGKVVVDPPSSPKAARPPQEAWWRKYY